MVARTCTASRSTSEHGLGELVAARVHPLRLELEQLGETRGERDLVVMSRVVGGGGVLHERRIDQRDAERRPTGRRSKLERQVLDQVRHAGASQGIVGAPDAVPHVDADQVGALVGKQGHLQSIAKLEHLAAGLEGPSRPPGTNARAGPWSRC